MLSSNAKATEAGRQPTRNASSRHRKQRRGRMGKFAESAAQYDVDRRGDGKCVAGRWIVENLDDEDLSEFIRLANACKWTRIIRLSDNNLKEASLTRHARGTCTCLDSVPAKGCCSSPHEETSS